MWNIERLDVYFKICELVKRVYVLIGALPKEEKFALGIRCVGRLLVLD